MFTRVPFVLAALVAATVIASACEPPFPLPPYEPIPKKPDVVPPPQVGTIVRLDGKEETVEYTVVIPVGVRDTLRVMPELRDAEGRKIPDWKNATGFRWEYRQVTRKSKIDRLKFFDATGKPVAMLDAWKRLEIGTTFFVSADGGPVSAAHSKLIAPDALVVVDFDNVVLERLLQELEFGVIEQLPTPGPKPRPRLLPDSWPEPR